MAQQLIKSEPKAMEYAPFGSEDKIKLDVAIVRKFLAVPTSEGDLPDDVECMKFMMLCRSRRLNPFEGDAYLIGFRDKRNNTIKWNLITAHQAFLKRAEASPLYDGKKSGIIISPAFQCLPCDGTGRFDNKVCPACDGKGWRDELEGDFLPDTWQGESIQLIGGWCKVFAKGRSQPEYQRLKLSTYKKPFGYWLIDPAGQICKCAEAAAMRAVFATVLGGLYLREEFHDITSEVVVKRPEFAPSEVPQLENGKPTAKAQPSASVAPPAAEPEPEKAKPAAARSSPPQAKPEAQATPAETNYIRVIRGLLQADKIKEPTLLQFLIELGTVNPDCKSLEAVALQQSEVLPMIRNQWPDISDRIKANAEENS